MGPNLVVHGYGRCYYNYVIYSAGWASCCGRLPGRNLQFRRQDLPQFGWPFGLGIASVSPPSSSHNWTDLAGVFFSDATLTHDCSKSDFQPDYHECEEPLVDLVSCGAFSTIYSFLGHCRQFRGNWADSHPSLPSAKLLHYPSYQHPFDSSDLAKVVPRFSYSVSGWLREFLESHCARMT